MSGKGSARRPAQIPDKDLAEKWDRIFNDKAKAIRLDALKTDSKESGRHLEEATDLSDEMRLIQQKMGVVDV